MSYATAQHRYVYIVIFHNVLIHVSVLLFQEAEALAKQQA